MQTLKKIHLKWLRISQKVAIFQAKLILTIFYFIILLPAGLIFSLFKDKLKIKKTYSTTWVIKSDQSDTLGKLKNQY